jgi:lipase chaperone LimK
MEPNAADRKLNHAAPHKVIKLCQSLKSRPVIRVDVLQQLGSEAANRLAKLV